MKTKGIYSLVFVLSLITALTGCSRNSSVASISQTSGNTTSGSSSTTIESTTIRQFPAVTGIRYDSIGRKLSWDPVSFPIPDGYYVSINCETPALCINKDAVKNLTSYSLTSGYTTFSVTISPFSAALGEGPQAQMQFDYLNPPVKNEITYSFGDISWPDVAGATSYDIYLNGAKTDNVQKTTYTLPGDSSDVNFSIMPLGTNTQNVTYYSAKSEEKEFKMLATPTLTFSKSNTTISWESVSGASGYHLEIWLKTVRVFEKDGGFGQDSNSTTYPFTDAGLYIVKLAAKSGNETSGVYGSRYASFDVTRLAAPTDLTAKEGEGSVDLKYTGSLDSTEYDVSLNGTSIGSSDTTSYSYPLADDTDDEVSYNFSVRARSNDNYVLDSLETANITITKLATPKNVKIEDAKVLWDVVSKANKYEVAIDGISQTPDTNEYTITTLGEGSHSLKVRALGNGSTIIRSNWSNAQTITKLKAPENLSINDDHLLTWDAVTGCNGYKVTMDNGANIYDATGNSFDIPTISASTTLTVVAVGDGGFVMNSDSSQPINLSKLSSPSGLQIQNGMVVWNSIANAASYQLSIGDVVKDVTGTSYLLDTFSSGNYLIKVKAIGNGQYYDSDNCTPISVTILPSIANITATSQDGITWSKVIEASGYRLFIDGGTPIDVNSNTLKYKPNFTTVGKHTVKIRALGNDTSNLLPSPWKETTITTSALSVPTNVAVSRTSLGFKVSATTDTNASGLAVSFSGKIYSSTTNEVEITTSTAGSYGIYCYALGDGTVYVNSERTTTTTMTILSSVSNLSLAKAATDYYIASWSPVSNADKYSVQFLKYTDSTTFTDTTAVLSAAKADIDTTGLVKLVVKVTAISDNPMTLPSETVSTTKTF